MLVKMMAVTPAGIGSQARPRRDAEHLEEACGFPAESIRSNNTKSCRAKKNT